MSIKAWILLPVVCLAAACSQTERVGNFTLRHHHESFGGHSSGPIELLYRGKVITPRVHGWSVDPRNPDRILYATTTKTDHGCGTFFMDAKSGMVRQLSPRSIVVTQWGAHPLSGYESNEWSPDGRYVYLGNDISRPFVFDSRDQRTIDLTAAVSREGRRLELHATEWSADSQRLAVIIAPDGYHGDYDLTAMTIDPLTVEYVATMTGSLPLWTTADYRWEGGTLAASPMGKNGVSFQRQRPDLKWVASPPPPSADVKEYECR